MERRKEFKGDFSGEKFIFSNYYEIDIIIDGKIFQSVEHWFQANKATNEKDFEYVRESNTAGISKRRGRNIKLREDWDAICEHVMYIGAKEKFKQHKHLRDALIATRGTILEEGNNWGDTKWGVDYYTRKGQNKLGIILMRVREELYLEFINEYQ